MLCHVVSYFSQYDIPILFLAESDSFYRLHPPSQNPLSLALLPSFFLLSYRPVNSLLTNKSNTDSLCTGLFPNFCLIKKEHFKLNIVKLCVRKQQLSKNYS